MGYDFDNNSQPQFEKKEPRGGIKKTWQNLIYKKCPVCHTQMERNRMGYECPNKDGCAFFISARKLGEILTDKTHAAIRFANAEQKEIIRETLIEIGIPQEDVRGII